MSLSFVFLPTVEFLGMAATGIVLLFGGLSVAQGNLTLGTVIAFLAYVNRFFLPVQELSQLYATMQTAMAGGERVINLLQTEPAIKDRPDARKMPPIEGRIEFRDVHFGYRENLPVLRDINLDIPAGTMVALVGPTGAGKTSIANLIARFYDVSAGEILIDGIDIREVEQRSMRSQMGLVSQDPFIFAGTIADNIRFGKPEASLEEVIAAGELANVGEFRERPAAWLRDRDLRRRRQSISRPTAADFDRARDSGRPAHPDYGRSDLERGHGHRSADPGCPAQTAERAQRHRHRPPAQHDRECRSHLCGR